MIRFKDKLTYALGNFSNGIVLQALTTYLVFFGTTILGLSGTLIGLVVAISVVWDAISDPFVGHISDFTVNKRFGRRHLYMIVGSAGLAVTNAVMWSVNGEWSYMTKAVIMFVSVIMVKTFMTIFVTPYNALGGELSADYYERNSIQAYRTVFFIAGLAFTTVAGMLFYFKPTDAYPKGQLNPASYQSLGLSISLLVLVCAGAAVVGTFKYIGKLPQNKRTEKDNRLGPMIREFRAIFGNKNYLYVAGAYLSANIATAIFGAVGLHVFTYTFGMDNYGIALVFGIIFGFSILSQPFWLDISKRHDKKDAAILAAKMSLTGSFIFLLLVVIRDSINSPFIWLLLYTVPMGIGFGGLITLPFSMIADTVDEEELMTGHRSEGLFYGGLTFSYKISQSIAIFIVGIILDLAGFNPDVTVQSSVTELIMGLVVALGAIAALFATIVFYRKYGLTKERIDEIKSIIVSRGEAS